MDLVIKRFINYLEGEFEQFRKNKIKELDRWGVEETKRIIVELTMAKGLIHYFENKREDIGIFFNYFFILSTYLIDSPLNIKEQMSIIFELCKRNYSLYHSESNILIYDYEKVTVLRAASLNNDDIGKLLLSSIYPNVFCCDDKDLTSEARKTKESLKHSSQLYTVDNYDVLDNCTIIKNCYFDKVDSYTKEDVQEIIIALKNLEVNKELCQKIRNVLLKDVNQRLKQEKLGSIQWQEKSLTELKKDAIQSLFRSQINYGEIYSELEKVVDLRDMWAKCSLTLEETIYYVSLLLRIKVERSKIQTFLKNVEIQNNGILCNPIALYLELYDKLKYYENRLVLSDAMKLLEDYFQELFIASDEEYEFWKLNLSQELSNYLNTIPGSFDYEIDMAKKRLEKKK